MAQIRKKDSPSVQVGSLILANGNCFRQIACFTFPCSFPPVLFPYFILFMLFRFFLPFSRFCLLSAESHLCLI